MVVLCSAEGAVRTGVAATATGTVRADESEGDVGAVKETSEVGEAGEAVEVEEADLGEWLSRRVEVSERESSRPA